MLRRGRPTAIVLELRLREMSDRGYRGHSLRVLHSGS
jgi:hypothetical protein